ncbi:MAG: protein kinase [Candidatus Eiseniibacteriota bacterium]|nr:MAG: protein kinase [Candidatus Eisenbacteria bacterium]
MIGKDISRYRILEKLGGGSMGVVYRAEDTKLKRTVALKFLPLHLTNNEEARSRFIREAQAASAMDHLNICTIHEIDETSAGQIFICMPFYTGETLKKKIARGPLPVGQVKDITRGVLNGLVKAHEHGIVHRDIKPANLMVTDDGVVKIVDFGLAKLAGAPGSRGGGMAVGTVAYMSPEQARGEEVDLRTDLWSLGVVAYEMLSGRLPFEADYPEALMYLILYEEPRSLTSFRSDVPDALRKVVKKAMSKDRGKRYQSAAAFLEDLDRLPAQGEAPSERKVSIAVLPFEDISPGRDNEYFSDGLTEEIISDLSRIHSLCVISRTSAMRLKGTDRDARTIGRDLNVRYLLEGSVRKVGSSLRVIAQLIDATTDSHVWAEKYSGTLEEVFDVQERVSRSIAEALRLKLSPEEERRIAERPIGDIRAYESYLKARKEIMRFTEEGLERSLQYLKEATDIVGENPLLLAGMGYTYWSFANLGVRPPEKYLSKAEACAARVFELEPDSPRGHMLLGLVSVTKGNVREGVRHLKRTLLTDPNNPDALFWLVIAYGSTGRTTLAMQFAERLLEVDPLTPINHATPGFALLCEGRFDLALHKEEKWHQMEPASAISRFWYAWVLAQNSRLSEAFSLFQAAAQDTPEDLWAQLGLCFRHALRGDSETLKSLAGGLETVAKWDLQYSWFLAECFALAGESDESLRWLENAVSRGFINYPLISKLDPFLENIRGEEQFEKLLERVKGEWEHFAV